MNERERVSEFTTTNRLTAFGLVALLAGFGSVAQASEVSFNVDGGIRWEDNIGLASESSDEIEDFTIDIGAALDWKLVQTETADTAISFGLYHKEVDEINDISHNGVEFKAHYQGQDSGDLTAFWWRLAGEFKTLKHRDSKIRDGHEWELGVTIGKRFNQTFGLSGGYRYEQRESTKDAGQNPIWRSNEVFDLKKDALFLQGDVSLGAVTTLSLAFTYKEGDEATSFRFGPQGDRLPWGWDPAFGPTWQVWKVDAEQYIYDISIVHAFSENFSVDAGYSYVDADAIAAGWWEPLTYKNSVLTASLSFQF